MAPTLQNLQDDLINKFDKDYWNAKARMYAKLLEDKKLREEILQRKDPEDREFLLTELNATKIHCCETLMRLIIIATFKSSPLIPLMALKQKEYNNEIDKMIIENIQTAKKSKEEIEKDEDLKFESYFKGKSEEYFRDHFFPILNVKNAEESATFMKKSVKKFLKELSNKSVYNVYKHGFYGSVFIQDNAKLTHTSKESGKITEHKITHLIRGLTLKKESSKGGNNHTVILDDHAIEIMRDRQIIDLASKFISNYYNVIRIGIQKPTQGIIYEFKNDDNYLDSVFKFESFVQNFNTKYPFKMPSNIKKQFKIKV